MDRGEAVSEDFKAKKGDRVRVVFEGDVVGDGMQYFRMGDSPIATDLALVYALKHAVSVEKIRPRLPTEPGSVIRSHFTTRALNEQGCWVNLTAVGMSHALDPSDRDDAKDLEVYAPLFDAGAV